jgi:hypothetical protein
MMNKEEVISKYNQLHSQLFDSLEGLKELMGTEEYQKVVDEKDSFSDEEYEKVEMMYGDFEVLVEDLASAY